MEIPTVLHSAQRLRYEALSNFATHLNRATTYKHVGDALAAHIKYVLNFYLLRLAHTNGHNEWCFEVSRGEYKIFRPKLDAARRFENKVLDGGLPVSMPANQLSGSLNSGKAGFAHHKIAHVYALPANYIKHQHVIITVGVQSGVQYIDFDFKFLRSIADLVANKLLQLDLLKKIERNNKELKQKNTEITRLNHDLNQIVAMRTSELMSTNEELRTLFYRTSHDFRAPLTNILGLAHLAQITCKDEDALALFNKCEEVVYKLDAMLGKLNVLSNPLFDGQGSAVNFNRLLTEIKTDYATRFKAANARLVFDINLPGEFIGNDHTFRSIFDNLLENSFTYRRQKLLVQVYVFRYKHDLIIKFSDNGQGIAPENLDRIFDMYYRGHADSPGSGLGLYVVRKLVRTLQGEVFAQSKPGSHTHFIIKIPFFTA